MSVNNFNIQGLTDTQVIESRKKSGRNTLDNYSKNPFIEAVFKLIKEPMVILLFITSTIYFISGNFGDGSFLAIAIMMVASISLYQDSRSRQALEKLKSFTQPKSKVIRNGILTEVQSDDLVIGDVLMVEEGMIIAADAVIINSNDFSVNESLLTGESFSVFKDNLSENSNIYSGTTVESGLAIATVNAIGINTALGKIGKSIEDVAEEKTPLEIQIGNFVMKMVLAGVVIFIIVWTINYLKSYDFLGSLLKALTLAMSILPEEIPVAFTTFMALGAWRLMKMGIIVKQMKTVETLGSATTICVDKTGTITENKMSIVQLFIPSKSDIIDFDNDINDADKELIRMAMWASEPIPFDAMEISLHQSYSEIFSTDERPEYKMVHEYPLSGKPPMMTHVFENQSGNRIIAAKGAPEALLKVCDLSSAEKQQIEIMLKKMTIVGYRVLGVGETHFSGIHYPEKQQDFIFNFKGLIAFYDPPKKNIKQVFDALNKAGITVKIITGDNSVTTAAIAKQVGFKGYEKTLTGEELMKLNDKDLKEKVKNTFVFTRMFPEAKLKIINTIKSNNEIVAMTGDGVNDGPALKAAHIGVAMGKKGTEIAKEAANLILQEDDLAKMVDAIAMGRKIYANLKKAIQYIISIHIPIILTVFLPLALGWIYPNIFTPIHIILLELIMGPTCSIIYENEPMEKNTLTQKPRSYSETFFNWKELLTSIIQGAAITLGTLLTYQFSVHQGYGESITRTMVFTALISSNIFLTLVNRSFYFSILTTIRYKNNLVLIIISITVLLLGLLLFIKPLSLFFKFESLNFSQLSISFSIGFLFVIWFELIKWTNRIKTPNPIS